MTNLNEVLAEDTSTPKYATYAQVLESRIRQGDYTVRGLPTEQELAYEVGVSRTTARRAILQLMEKGILVRKPHGKIAVNHSHEEFAGRLRLAFLTPAWSSPAFELWRYAVERSASKAGADVRSIDFVHWNDSVIPQTLAGFDGVFLVPSSEPIPEEVFSQLAQARNLVVLDGDFSARGIPSVQLLPPVFVHRLGDHLYDLGHREIDCLNTQPHDDVIKARIEQWELWQRVRKTDGRLIDEPVEPFEHTVPKAYAVMKRLLERGEFKATALVCMTDVMTGVTRAMHEHGLRVGHDVAICTVSSDEGLAQYFVPSRTELRTPDRMPYTDLCLDWFTKGGAPWIGPKLIQPASMELFVGESTTGMGPK